MLLGELPEGESAWDPAVEADVSLERLAARRVRRGAGAQHTSGTPQPRADPRLAADAAPDANSTGGAGPPPFFVWHCADDAVVPVENSVRLASALVRAGVPTALHVFERGLWHGIRLAEPSDVAALAGRSPAVALSPEVRRWPQMCVRWLRHHFGIPDSGNQRN